MKEPLYHDPHRSPVRGCCILQASILVLHNKTYKLQNFSEECLINSLVRFQCMNDQKKNNSLYVFIHSPFTSTDFKIWLVNQRQDKQKTPATDDPHVCRKQSLFKTKIYKTELINKQLAMRIVSRGAFPHIADMTLTKKKHRMFIKKYFTFDVLLLIN